MANSQTVHIPVKSKRVLTFINAKYAPDGFYKLSQKQTLGVFITSILVSKKKSDHVCFHQLQNSFTGKLGSYKHLDQKCFIKASAVPEFNRYVEHLMKEYFYAWMAFYASFPKTAILTLTPFATCSITTELVLSATSAVISIPLFIGPGCKTRACFCMVFNL